MSKRVVTLGFDNEPVMFFRASFRGLERSGERRASNACGAGDESVSVRADACACFEFLREVRFLLVTDEGNLTEKSACGFNL
jgi:hypothetical protein